MSLTTIKRNCAYEPLADAAAISLGGGFYDLVRRKAAAHGTSVGSYVAVRVKRFAWRATPDDIAKLERATRGAQTPLLAGLRRIIEGEWSNDVTEPPLALFESLYDPLTAAANYLAAAIKINAAADGASSEKLTEALQSSLASLKRTCETATRLREALLQQTVEH